MKFTASIRAEAFLSRLSASPERLAASMRAVLNRLSIRVQSVVKESKLTGQVLHVRSGTLRRSINRRLMEDSKGFFAQVGTNVKYGAVHEYGFTGTVNVRAYVRRLYESAQVGKKKRKVTGSVLVKAHQRAVRIPERSYLRSTVREMMPYIRREIRQEALKAIK